MKEVNWTKEQSLAIKEKGENILVAAAAGSGKTAVLVERIINKIVNDKIDIDKILVVTFTKATASEMKARVLDAIYKKIEEDPFNKHLQRQITLLSKASLCTIDSFCLEVVKNNFFEIGISPNLGIAENTEIQILKQEVLEELFENKYEEEDKEFLSLINMYTSYKGDDELKNVILDIYDFIQSTPFPEKWLKEKVEQFNVKEISFEKTLWGKILFSKAKAELQDIIFRLEEILDCIKYEQDIEKFVVILSEDIRKIKEVYNAKTWDELYIYIKDLRLDRFPVDKRVPEEIKVKIKDVRTKIKKDISNIDENILMYTSKDAIDDISQMHSILLKIEKVVLEFLENFAKAKQERNIMDFSDIEHFALDILANDTSEENHICRKYKEKYEEILIDEYQDSNLVQESILNSISRGNNTFMVGDVKQSIYKFRQARPEIFLEKYEKYKNIEELKEKEDLKIQLFKNFRSRRNVLSMTNIVFDSIMSKDLGDIEYNEKEYLNLGANYPECKDLELELNVIDLKEEESIYKDNIEEDEAEEKIEDAILEAKFVAKRIKELIDDPEYMVCNKDGSLRRITYKDIAILLRSTKTLAPIYEQEISKLNIPVFCDTLSGYINSVEIQVIMSLLKIIDNPTDDISCVTVLRSMIGGFSDNELIKIRIGSTSKSFYESMCEYMSKKDADEALKNKIDIFLNKINSFRNEQEYMNLAEFIWKIYLDTGYYSYVSLMPNGTLRASNLKMLFEKAKQYEKTSFKGLYNFISFIDKLKLSNGDMSGAKLIGENEDVLRIMSIHKSKGLEFPVVFLCGMSKHFNMQDINTSNVLLHQDLGFGPKYINYEEGERYTTLAREAIKIKTREELISEEMRVLYVALTRAKEKLILTGIEKDYNKSIQKKEKVLNSYKELQNIGKINKNIIEKYISYLDWIELVFIKRKQELDGLLKVNIYKKKELLNKLLAKEEKEERDFKKELKNINNKHKEEIKEKLEWEYKYKMDNNIQTKSSVTKIKNMVLDISKEEENIEYMVPEFLKEEKILTPAEKGTLMHLIMQKLDINVDYDEKQIENFISDLEERHVISKKEKEAVDIEKVLNFTKSNIVKEMKKAKEVCKEMPFYMNIPAKELYEEDIEENILVQGVIDLYYTTEEDELVLVDYKTDRLTKEEEFIEKYKEQLKLYKEALERALNKKVDRVYIYSVFLGSEIMLLLNK